MNYQDKYQKGVVMLISLIVLIAVTLLGIFAMKSIGLNEGVAGNTMDKQRSMQAAESTLRFGENWIKQGNYGSRSNCTETQPINGNLVSNVRVCNTPMASLALPWTGAMTYTPLDVTVSSNGGLAAADPTSGLQDVNYFSAPQLRVDLLTQSPSNGTVFNFRGEAYFQVSAMAQGANQNTVSIVQSTYTLKMNNINLGG